MKRPKHGELIERENKIGLANPQNPHAALMLDRFKRWTEYIEGLTVPAWLTLFIEFMTDKYGPVVSHRGRPMPWLMAFLVVRYGEAEYNWPREADEFTKGDQLRAMQWSGRRPTRGDLEVPHRVQIRDRIPRGIQYLKAGSGS